MNKCLLKIGLDFHGVINKRPEFFSEFCNLALQRGYEIHVITGGPLEVVKEMLNKWHVRYSHIFAILDYYESVGNVSYFENGEIKVPVQLWDTAKAEYCMRHGINMHIDDSSQYVKWFSTPYCHYDVESCCCTTENSNSIDFSQTPEKTLTEIERIVSKVQYY